VCWRFGFSANAAQQLGNSVQFTMLPGNMLLVDTNTGSIMFCDENTDFSQYSPYPCGA